MQSTESNIPIFRILGSKGELLSSKYIEIEKATAVKILENMIKIKVFDQRYNMAQREGKISFYMTCIGEEGAVVGSAAALEPQDSIYPQYREAAALLYRGFTSHQMTNQLVGNYLDNGKGRQMPVHYGSKEFNYQTVSSPLATQIPQAAGAGYYFRVRKENKVCMTYFGEGAASEGDFHAGMNFAATLNSQTLFFCRNNKYAISTAVNDQFKGDGIASRAIGYGMNSIRVDGNDALAVYYVTKQAREYSIKNGVPILIEAMSFRGGDHSTSDASKAYRDDNTMKNWEEYLTDLGDPFGRLGTFLLQKGWIESSTIDDLSKKYKEEARESLKFSLSQKKPSIRSMFEDIYETIPESLANQQKELNDHIKKYGHQYEIESYHS